MAIEMAIEMAFVNVTNVTQAGLLHSAVQGPVW